MTDAPESHASPGMGTNLGIRSQVARKAQGGQFEVPPLLRARVDFWKDVFTKYTSQQVVVHHRDFPQIRFGVLDFSSEAKSMNPVQFERYKDKAEADAVATIKRQLVALSQGEEPQTPFQRDAVELLRDIPGGNEKYKKLVDEDLVRTQTGIRERYAEAIRRSWKYLPVMEQIFVSEFGLPKELTRVPFIESSFDYTAYSSVGAAGIWQFMPRTARSHKLLVGRYVDERRDPIRATRAAAEYLRGAYKSLGNWPLAITSYNHGIGGVRSKVKKAGTDDLASIIEDRNERYFGFASTNFYPEFLAALEIYEDHKRYFPEIPEQPPLRVYTVPLSNSMSIAQAARQIGVPVDALKDANYALLDPVWKGAARVPAGYQLRVPIEFQSRGARTVIDDLPAKQAPIVPVSATATAVTKHRVKRGETLASIAARYKTTPSELRALNSLANSSLKSGQLLVVRREVADSKPAQASSSPSLQQSQVVASRDVGSVGMPSAIERAEADEPDGQKGAAGESVRRFYVVQRGDSLFGISKKTGSPIEQLRRANGLRNSQIAPGQKLLLP